MTFSESPQWGEPVHCATIAHPADPTTVAGPVPHLQTLVNPSVMLVLYDTFTTVVISIPPAQSRDPGAALRDHADSGRSHETKVITQLCQMKAYRNSSPVSGSKNNQINPQN
jgi:hypothetical protein